MNLNSVRKRDGYFLDTSGSKKQCEEISFFGKLSEEIILNIFSYLSYKDIISNVSIVKKQWKKIADDESLWKLLYKQVFSFENESTNWKQEFMQTHAYIPIVKTLINYRLFPLLNQTTNICLANIFYNDKKICFGRTIKTVDTNPTGSMFINKDGKVHVCFNKQELTNFLEKKDCIQLIFGLKKSMDSIEIEMHTLKQELQVKYFFKIANQKNLFKYCKYGINIRDKETHESILKNFNATEITFIEKRISTIEKLINWKFKSYTDELFQYNYSKIRSINNWDSSYYLYFDDKGKIVNIFKDVTVLLDPLYDTMEKVHLYKQEILLNGIKGLTFGWQFCNKEGNEKRYSFIRYTMNKIVNNLLENFGVKITAEIIVFPT